MENEIISNKIKNKRTSRIIKLRDKLINEYPELTTTSHRGDEIKSLSFAEQVKTMYEIENIKTQKITQWVLIILTVCNLILLGFQIYLQFLQ